MGFILALQLKSVQTFFAQKAAQYLSSELHTRIEIKSLYIIPFRSLVLEDLYVEDLKKDTLLYTPKLSVKINLLSLKKRKISIGSVTLDHSQIYLKEFKDKTSNISFILNYFKNDTTSKSEPIDVTLDKIILNDIAFKYKDFGDTTTTQGVNFADIALSKLSVTVSELDIKNHIAKAQLSNLTFRDKSGFYLKNLTSLATIDKNFMEFKNLLIETPHTKLGDYFSMKYNTFDDFSHFVSKVTMKANFKNATLYSRDVAYFASDLFPIDININLNGNIKGRVNNLKAKQLAIKAGKATYIKGDFDIQGLPMLNKTFLDLNFTQAFFNKADLDYIIAKVTNQKGKLIPDAVNKFGNINFKGRLTGFTNDFIAFGEFKTKLGRITSDVNMKIASNGKPSYSGSIKTFDFNIGSLADEEKLGRVSLVANIVGEEFDINKLREQIKGQIHYLDFNNYRYTNVTLDGNYQNKNFKGKLLINDENINLAFFGSINLKPKLPVFNFNASIKDANLKKLNLVNDTLIIDATVATNFSGINLDNIQGNFTVNKARLTNAKQNATIDSIKLKATGIGNNRSLIVQSDILDASLEGNYDISTLPAYFISVIKKYIPSLDVKTASYKPQDFDLRIKLKNFKPINMILAPSIKIPYEGVLSGKFSSSNHLTTFNAYTKVFQYKKFKINNLIIDQNTQTNQLDLFITSDRVDISDSLYVKNVNIASILSRDSVKFNVKLSDKDATNQLDLNGLVEFNAPLINTDSKIRVSILPSDVIINHDVWKIQDKVSIGFDKGKTVIKNFGLFRDNQLLTIDGTISSNPTDKLFLGFNKFKLTTFNPLTKGLGIRLDGKLNGRATLSNLQDEPNIQSDIRIDSMMYNNIAIGNLLLETKLDNATKLIDTKLSVHKNDEQIADIKGTYDLKNNELDWNVKIDRSPIAIVQPFLIDLVSNLSGNVSADLKITGQPAKLQINGNLNLEEVGLTVDYLKTHYRVSNNLTVKDNIIKLTNLVLRDDKNNEAIGNGTVNLNKLNNLEIQARLKATNFMVLNTTLKDNSLYYGTAFGTGTFSFNGPLNNLHIDINAETQPGTIFNIPLNSAEKVGDNGFISFVQKDSTNLKSKLEDSGLSMNFDLQITEDAEVNLYTALGKLTGRGHSSLNLQINNGDFNMFGDYQITNGKFNFSTRGIINKMFDIKPGGTIRWTGDPSNATINIQTIYSVRTSIKPLYLAAGSTVNADQRVVSEAIMNLDGALLNPHISFSINFPNDPLVQTDLAGYLSDVNNTNQQALSLIALRSFVNFTQRVDQQNTSTSGSSQIGTRMTTELALNSASSVLANTLNLRFVDFNIKSLNEYSLSVRLWNDRLIFTGGATDNRVDAGDFSLINTSSSVYDVGIRYLINKDGSLAVNLSSKPYTRNIYNINNTIDAQNVNSAGLTYSQEFDNFGEFFIGKLIKKIINNSKKERQTEKKDTPTPKEEIDTKEKTK